MSRPRPGDPRVTPGRRPAPAAKPAGGTSPAIIVLGVVLILIAFGCGYGALTIQADVSQPVAKAGAPNQAFVVKTGDTFKTITVNLENQKLIRNATVFQYYVKFKGITPSISPGTYQLSPSMTFSLILSTLAQGVAPLPVAYINILDGMRVSQYPAAIAQATDKDGNAVTLSNFKATDFIDYAVTGKTFDGEDKYWYVQPWDTTKGAYAALEGYLYPAKYEIYQSATAVDIIKLMLNTFGEKLCPGPDAADLDKYIFDQAMCKANEKKIDYTSNDFAGTDGKVLPVTGAGAPTGIFEALAAKGLTLQQALILASIVEREARTPVNQAYVSSVYYNRFKNATSETVGFLNADPAYQYYLGSQAGATDPWAPLAKLPSQTETKNPYNLYASKGLPPSAISNPFAVPLYVAIFPPTTKYYYFFFGKDCNNHYEATSYQNQLDVNKYGIAGASDCKN